jgi:hypothetical protein
MVQQYALYDMLDIAQRYAYHYQELGMVTLASGEGGVGGRGGGFFSPFSIFFAK